jgi:hypothetical protein
MFVSHGEMPVTNAPRRRNASGSIDIRLDRADQLFHTLDPHARWHRHIDERIEEFLIQEARRLPRKARIRVRLFVENKEAQAAGRPDVGHALRAHFAYRARVENENLHDLLIRGVFSLAVGLLVLAGCLKIGPWIGSYTREATGNFIDTAFQIIGWAANWRPVEIFLYDWWPVAEDRRLYRRLAGAHVELLPMAEADLEPAGRKRAAQPAAG